MFQYTVSGYPAGYPVSGQPDIRYPAGYLAGYLANETGYRILKIFPNVFTHRRIQGGLRVGGRSPLSLSGGCGAHFFHFFLRKSGI